VWSVNLIYFKIIDENGRIYYRAHSEHAKIVQKDAKMSLLEPQYLVEIPFNEWYYIRSREKYILWFQQQGWQHTVDWGRKHFSISEVILWFRTEQHAMWFILIWSEHAKIYKPGI
jgi:hypothetical protein